MTLLLSETDEQPRDKTYWAEEAGVFKVERTPTGALNLNVEGHGVLSPLQGFGQLWQKVYYVRVKNATVTPSEVVSVWKQNFPRFWPKGNRFHAVSTGIAPGSVALLRIGMPSVPGGLAMISTGVFVLYADDESFTFTTPEGHMFASWITFSAHEEDDSLVVQIHILLRANDPLYEMGMRLRVIPFIEDRFWKHTLTNLVAHFNISAPVQLTATRIDKRIQWSQARNIWRNAAIRTVIHTALSPLRRVRGKFQR